VVELNDCKLEALAIFNIEGKLTFANPSFYQLFGYKPTAQLVGKPLESFLAFPEQGHESCQWLKEQAYWAGKITGTCEDSSSFSTYLNFFKINTAQDGMTGLPGSKEQTITVFILLFAASGQRIPAKRELKRLYDQKMETVARMANGMAHDLNNIMTVINGYTDILLESLDEEDPVKKSMQLIAKAGQKANDFIRQLLTIGKRHHIKNEDLDLNTLIRELQVKLEQTAGTESQLRYQLAEQLWQIEGDKELLEQILNILVINARENSNRHGRITINTQNQAVSEASTAHLQDGVAQGKYVLLTVTDNGEALTAERLATLFDPFAAMKEKDKSLSLGLTKMYAVISQMLGYIFPVSEPGQGNSLQIYIPSSQSFLEQMVDREKTGLSTRLKNPLSILVVEDELDISHFIKTVLMIPESNYQICEASNGRVALDICHKTSSKPDVLITDVVMPHMNGVELYTNLKRTNPKLKVLFISGYAHAALQTFDESLQRINFLEKPFTASQLLDRLEAIISAS
jgi:two-component system cell cycle sensor histidine kinase/response regulator CckA